MPGASEDHAIVPLPIDWDAFFHRCMKRQPLLDKVMRSVLGTQSETPEKLRQAAVASDFEALAFTAHNLKGIAGMIEAQALRETAEELMLAAREQRREAAALAEKTAMALEKVLTELQTRADQLGN
jgi:HPt (histidine-containing phosphotransfer) domain-containing protein